jgi:hypothetical protein
MTVASSLAALSLPRSSDGAAIDAHQNPHAASLHSNDSDSSSSGQIPGSIDLKTVGPEQQVASIQYSDGTFYVVTNSGTTASFPEFNLRFKTDSGAHGPARKRPVLLSAGMHGDRGSVVFSSPGEIGSYINDKY